MTWYIDAEDVLSGETAVQAHGQGMYDRDIDIAEMGNAIWIDPNSTTSSSFTPIGSFDLPLGAFDADDVFYLVGIGWTVSGFGEVRLQSGAVNGTPIGLSSTQSIKRPGITLNSAWFSGSWPVVTINVEARHVVGAIASWFGSANSPVAGRIRAVVMGGYANRG